MHFTSRASIVSAAAAVLLAFGWLVAEPHVVAQNRKNYSILNDQSGHAALGLALRKLTVAGTFMQCPAHPDDESNALLAYYGYGQGLRVIDLQNSRGEGGQNEIGPELFRDMGVLRTSELLAAHRIDGAEQFFTRAIDYGYSFDPQEVIRFWGRDDIIGDYVRLFRTLRPDVVLTMNIQGGGGDRAHEATTLLVREAFRAAGDPLSYPDQIKEGLRPWQPSKLYFSGAGGGGGGAPAAAHVARVDTSAYDALLGRTYAEIGADARSSHKCQGVGSSPPAIGGGGRGGGRGGGPGGGAYTLVDTTIAGQAGKDETSLMDGIDVSLTGLARYAGFAPPVALTSGLAAIAEQADRANVYLNPATMPARPRRSRPA
jgi:LmbE family N-acetylglucosaminyl deacetylase